MDGLVSVVVPTRDRRDRVVRAVRSVLAQTWPRLEVLVVDDGSSDGTAAAVEALAEADDRVRLLTHDRPRGAPAARNTGIDAAAGDHLAFLDDDDEWLPAKVERQVALLAGRPGAAAVSCRYELVAGGRSTVFRGPGDCTHAALLWEDFAGSASACLWRRARLDPEPRFDESFPACQDWDVWLQAASQGAVAVVPEPLVRYHAHAGPRITGDDDARASGRRRLLDKHGEAMTSRCRRYQEARIELLRSGGGRSELAVTGRWLRRDPWVVGVLLAASAAGRLGERRGDPGRGMRALHRLVGRP